MSQPVYQEGGEHLWWWKVAKHLDAAQLAAVNAMSHNLDDQTAVFALQEKLREAQVILLEIFRGKGMLPGDPNGPIVSVPVMVTPTASQGLGEDPPPIVLMGATPSPEVLPPIVLMDSVTSPEALGEGHPPIVLMDGLMDGATSPEALGEDHPPIVSTDDVPLSSVPEPLVPETAA